MGTCPKNPKLTPETRKTSPQLNKSGRNSTTNNHNHKLIKFITTSHPEYNYKNRPMTKNK
jgi:hypothetical protein